MQPTMHRPNWDDPSERSYDDNSRGGLGAVVAFVAIVLIAILAMSLGGDTDTDGADAGTPGDTAITETDPTLPTDPIPTTTAP